MTNAGKIEEAIEKMKPVEAFALLVSKCASGLLLEFVEGGKSDTEARNAIINYFLDFASGEACRVARSEGREPDHDKWRKATDAAFERAVFRTALKQSEGTQ